MKKLFLTLMVSLLAVFNVYGKGLQKDKSYILLIKTLKGDVHLLGNVTVSTSNSNQTYLSPSKMLYCSKKRESFIVNLSKIKAVSKCDKYNQNYFVEFRNGKEDRFYINFNGKEISGNLLTGYKGAVSVSIKNVSTISFYTTKEYETLKKNKVFQKLIESQAATLTIGVVPPILNKAIKANKNTLSISIEGPMSTERELKKIDMNVATEICFKDLKPGDYKVSALLNGERITKTVKVTGDTATIIRFGSIANQRDLKDKE